MRILLVEDQAPMREAIAERLRAHGHSVDAVPTSAEADLLVGVNPYTAIVLDRMLPDGDGLTLLARWRDRDILIPMLMLTAMDGITDRVDGLQRGADDYLVKPFSMDELMARISAVARRGPVTRPPVVEVADLQIDVARFKVRRAGVLLPLRPKEFALLELLATHRGTVVSREKIVSHCWDEAHSPMSNVEEALIASLRRKLGKPSLIRTVRGAGYVLESPGGTSGDASQ